MKSKKEYINVRINKNTYNLMQEERKVLKNTWDRYFIAKLEKGNRNNEISPLIEELERNIKKVLNNYK